MIKNQEINLLNGIHVAFLSDNTLAIADSTYLLFYDIDNPELFQYLQYVNPIDDIAVNKTRSRLAVSYGGTVREYDTQTQSEISAYRTDQPFAPITYTSQQDLLIIQREDYNYLGFFEISAKRLALDAPMYNKNRRTFITCHPQEDKIIYIETQRNSLGTHPKALERQYFYQLSIIRNAVSQAIAMNKFFNAAEYQYSPDAKYILINQTCYGLTFKKSDKPFDNTCKLLLCNQSRHQEPLCDDINLQFPSATFYSSSAFFITLSRQCILQYWKCESVLNSDDQNAPKPSYSMPLCTEETYIDTEALQKRLSFSPDGTLLAVALPNKCLVLPVPTEVIASSFPPELTKIFLLILCTKNKA